MFSHMWNPAGGNGCRLGDPWAVRFMNSPMETLEHLLPRWLPQKPANLFVSAGFNSIWTDCGFGEDSGVLNLAVSDVVGGACGLEVICYRNTSADGAVWYTYIYIYIYLCNQPLRAIPRTNLKKDDRALPETVA